MATNPILQLAVHDPIYQDGSTIRAEMLRRVGDNRTHAAAARILADIFLERIEQRKLSVRALAVLAAHGAIYPSDGFQFEEPLETTDD